VRFIRTAAEDGGGHLGASDGRSQTLRSRVQTEVLRTMAVSIFGPAAARDAPPLSNEDGAEPPRGSVVACDWMPLEIATGSVREAIVFAKSVGLVTVGGATVLSTVVAGAS
jgi:hypothetical protein